MLQFISPLFGQYNFETAKERFFGPCWDAYRGSWTRFSL